MSETANSTASTSNSSTLLANGLQALSCVRCARRKVKCDRVDPCSNCVKQSASCEYREGTAYKRKKKGQPEGEAQHGALQHRLEMYEMALRDLGIDPTTLNAPVGSNNSDAPRKRPTAVISLNARSQEKSRGHISEGDAPQPQGKLIVQDGKSRYLEGATWVNVGGMAENQSALLPDSDDEGDEDGDESPDDPGLNLLTSELILGRPAHVASIRELYPTPSHFAKLWHAFIENVHPITMAIHPPSIRGSLLEAIKSQECVAKDVEVLLFAIMAAAVMSLTDDGSLKLLGEHRSVALSRYRRGARQALSNAKFLLSSSFAVLQAFTIYLLSIGPEVDPRILWNLSGIALRNGQRLGLHKDLVNSGLTPFEVEMRRRLWYQIVGLDVICAQYAGCATALNIAVLPTNWPPPLNVNDSDLDPDMRKLPLDREGATDMIFCRLGYKIFIRTTQELPEKTSMEEGYWMRLGGDISLGEKDKIIDEIERTIELNVLRYCDVLQPVHLLTTAVARLIICKMRFAAHHPRRFQQSGQDVPQVELDFVFRTALKVVEYDNAIHEQPALKRFVWHSHQHFQWSCLFHVLYELKTRTHGDEADLGWEQVRLAYHSHPEIALPQRFRQPLCTAINRIALEAWACREKAVATHTDEYPLETPEFMLKLRQQQNSTAQLPKVPRGTPPSSNNDSTNYYHQYPTPVSYAASLDQFMANPQSDAPMIYGNSTYDIHGLANGPMDWNLVDSLINGEILQGFGDAPLSGANFWNASSGT